MDLQVGLPAAALLEDNEYVEFHKSATLSTGIYPCSGGTDGTDSPEAHMAFQKALEQMQIESIVLTILYGLEFMINLTTDMKCIFTVIVGVVWENTNLKSFSIIKRLKQKRILKLRKSF